MFAGKIKELSDQRPGLYVHVPLCHSKCFYCDFYSRPVRNGSDADALLEAIGKEMSLRGKEYNHPEGWRTLYVGGGTPSLLTVEQLERLTALLDCGDRLIEATIEANPEDVTPQWIEAIARLGFTRVSMGVQSFVDSELRAVGRRHTAAMAIDAMCLLRESGLDYSVDLIYGLPGQTLGTWEKNLATLARFNPDHFSAYLLSYEPGTRLYASMIAGKIIETDEMTAQVMYNLLCDFAEAHGYNHYEISNFARAGSESRHNSSYWDGRPYLGLGPGAHSFNGVRYGANPSDLKNYIDSLRQGVPVYSEIEETAVERFNDILITALRTSRGMDLSATDVLDKSQREQFEYTVAKLLSEGVLMHNREGRLVIPQQLWLTADAVMRQLIQL